MNAPWADARLFKTRIRRNIRLAESPSFGQSIFQYSPTSRGAEDYASLAAELQWRDPAPIWMADDDVVATTTAAVAATVPAEMPPAKVKAKPTPEVTPEPPAVIASPPVKSGLPAIIPAPHFGLHANSHAIRTDISNN